MNTRPLVSVIIPTYNRGYCLRESIGSVLKQDHQKFELLVVDDYSSDNTPDLMTNIPGLRYFRLPTRSGVSKARNVGIKNVKGKYICFLDSDDLWMDNKLRLQVAWMESNPECQVSYTDEIWIRHGVRVNPMKKHQKYCGDIFNYCLPLCIVSPSSVMLRSSLFEKVGDFDETLPACEDYDLWLRIASVYPIHFINEKLIVKTGGHRDQLSKKYWGMDRFRVFALQKLIKQNHLNAEQRKLSIQTLVEKCSVLHQGFFKRGKTAEAEYYRSLAEIYLKYIEDAEAGANGPSLSELEPDMPPGLAEDFLQRKPEKMGII
ncbi:MAG: glycosyltransferase family 2 protein [Desulfobacterales bacterium]